MKRKELRGEIDRLPDAQALLELTCDVLTRQCETRSEYAYTIAPKSEESGRKSFYILQREEK